MILNAYAVLALLFVVLLVAAGTVLGVTTLRVGRGTVNLLGAGSRDSVDAARPLTLQLLGLISLASVISVALWGLLLQSYVPQWDGLRCAVGVLRVGTGSDGAPGLLPDLANATTWLLPATVFVAGLGVVLHVLGRDRPMEGLPPLHRAVLVVAAFLAIATGAAEAAWIVIPKAERFLAAGCCTTAGAAELTAISAGVSTTHPGTLASLFALPALALSGLLAGWPVARAPRLADLLRVLAAAVLLVGGFLFAREVVAPAVLGLPLHRCYLCLAADAPEAALGMGLLFVPLFATGWRTGGRVLTRSTGPAFERLALRLDRAAFAGALGGLLLLVTMWWIAV